jgi:hypothetical protein
MKELPRPILRREGAHVVALQQTVNWSRLIRREGFSKAMKRSNHIYKN